MFNAINFTNGCADQNCGTIEHDRDLHQDQRVPLPVGLDRLTTSQGHNNYMGSAGSAPNSFYGWNSQSKGSTGPYRRDLLLRGGRLRRRAGRPPAAGPTARTRSSAGSATSPTA